MMMEDMLEDLGHLSAGVAASVTEGLKLLEQLEDAIDAVMLDLNLGGQISRPIAVKLRDKAIPFIITTGYDEAQVEKLGFHEAVLRKPFQSRDLDNALARLVSGER